MLATDKTDRLLALLLVAQLKGVPQREKVLQLNLAGFSNVEIAELLRMKSTAVAQSLYEAKKAPRAAKPATSKRKTQ